METHPLLSAAEANIAEARDDARRNNWTLAAWALNSAIEALRITQDDYSRAALRTGASYTEVARALGISRQAARQRFPGLSTHRPI